MKIVFVSILVFGVGLYAVLVWSKNKADQANPKPPPGLFTVEEIKKNIHKSQKQDIDIPMHTSDQPSTSPPVKGEVTQKMLDSSSPAPRMPDKKDLKSFSLNASWKVWPRMTAVKPSYASPVDELDFGKVGGFTLMPTQNIASTEEQFFSEKPAIVYNPRLNRAGVVTGTIKLFLNEGSDIAEVEKSYDLVTLNPFPNINLYFVTARNQPFNLKKLVADLKSDSQVKNAEIEIVSHTYEKK